MDEPNQEIEDDEPLFGDDDSDADQDYLPEDDSSSDSLDPADDPEEENVNAEPLIEELPANAIPPPNQTGKKRIRRPDTWKQNRAKIARNSGEAYVDKKHNTHESKRLGELQNHHCRYKCTNNISQDQRLSIFKEYWALGSWDLQTAFLNGAIQTETITRKKPNAVSNKEVSCVYNLGGFRVCKEFLMKTLDVSNKRLQNVVENKKRISSGVACKDKRGKKSPPNKISERKVEIIKEHINKFPRYTSHYTRNKTPNRRYLPQDCNLKEMYKLYCDFSKEEKQEEPVKESFYRNIFSTQFNLSFKRPSTDTCDKCDKFEMKINHSSAEEKALAQIEKEIHLRKAEAVRTAKEECHKLKDDSRVAIIFDLQKPMPTPNVSTSKAYYLRQLWTFN